MRWTAAGGEQQERENRAGNLGNPEARQIDRADTRKGVCQRPGQRNGWIGEGRRRSEPVGGGNVEPDQPRHGSLLEPHAGEDHRHQAEGRDTLGEPLGAARPYLAGQFDQRQSEHQVGCNCPGHAAADLRQHISAEIALRQCPGHRKDHRHGRIEVCAGDRPEDRDQHHQDGAGRQRIAEQRQTDVLRQRCCHDARADDGRDQQGSP